MLNLRQIANDTVAGSPVIAGHDKIKTEDVIALFPNGITINRVDLCKGEKGDFAVVNFTENPAKYYAGGALITSIVKAWLIEAGGCLDDVNAALAADPVRVKLTNSRTKDGKSLTAVTIL